MNKTVQILLMVALVMLAAGGASYYYGHQQNVVAATEGESLLQISGGDKWLFMGGVAMMLGAALGFGSLKFWLQERRKSASGFVTQGAAVDERHI